MGISLTDSEDTLVPQRMGTVMNLLSRMLVLTALLVAAPLTATGASAQPSESPSALTIEGDAITRLASSSPEATSQVVVGRGVHSREAGGDWSRTGDAPGSGAIVFAADDPGLLLNGDHAPCLRGGTAAPLERSEDGGATWEPVEGIEGLRPLVVWSDSGIALGATCSGMMLSTDAGKTWSALAGIEAGYEITAFASIASEDGSGGPSVLFGMTSEGGTSRLYRLDLSDPADPTLSEPLREYWAIAGIAARGDLYVLAAADGVWVSEDAGRSWERSADGLDDVTLEEDPSQAGLPADVEPGSFGLFAAAFLGADNDALVVGSANGMYTATSPAGPWAPLDGSTGEIRQIDALLDADPVLFAADDSVFEVPAPDTSGMTADSPVAGTAEPATAQSAMVSDEVTITIVDFAFDAETVTVAPGTTVTWVNEGPTIHNTVSKDDLWSSEIMEAGDTFSFTFENPGTYPYLCTLHPIMLGTIVVDAEEQ